MISINEVLENFVIDNNEIEEMYLLSSFHRLLHIDLIFEGIDKDSSSSDFITWGAEISKEEYEYYEMCYGIDEMSLNNLISALDVNFRRTKDIEPYAHLDYFFSYFNRKYIKKYYEVMEIMQELKDGELEFVFNDISIIELSPYFNLMKKDVDFFDTHLYNLNSYYPSSVQYSRDVADFIFMSSLPEKIISPSGKWKDEIKLFKRIGIDLPKLFDSKLYKDMRGWRNYLTHDGFDYDILIGLENEKDETKLLTSLFTKVANYINMSFIIIFVNGHKKLAKGEWDEKNS